MNNVAIRILIIALLCIAVVMPTAAQERFRIMEYNVENLFDTIPSPYHDDRDFLPEGKQHWTSQRYWAKQGRLARVIAAAGGDAPVELVGLVEVENDTALAHLTRRTSLARLGYEYIVTDGPDLRGINVGLLYQPGRFRLLRHQEIRVPIVEGQRPTRNVLLVEGLLPTLDTLSIFVAHFPSRRGGKGETEAHRCRAAKVIRQTVDSIQRQRPKALIVVMGDMNDEVHDTSLREVLHVKVSESEGYDDHSLYSLAPRCAEHPEITGTYYYQQEWNRIDHIIVSGGFFQPSAALQAPRTCRILAYPFLLDTSDSEFAQTFRPSRNYLGTFYKGGFSDHLPLLLEFLVRH